MKNGRYEVRRRGSRTAGTIAGQLLLGVAAVSAVIVFVRSLPDLLRYLRLRRM
jgi:hypothetical protein